MYYEPRNLATLANINKTVAEKARLALADLASSKMEVLFTCGYRSPGQQSVEYAKGRTTPGTPCRHGGIVRPIGTCKQHPLGLCVTWAKAGESYHQYGLALDFCPSQGAVVMWNVPFAPYAEVFKKYGFEWAGNWPEDKREYAHLQYTFGLTIKDLLAGKRPPEPKPLPQRFIDRGIARQKKA